MTYSDNRIILSQGFCRFNRHKWVLDFGHTSFVHFMHRDQKKSEHPMKIFPAWCSHTLQHTSLSFRVRVYVRLSASRSYPSLLSDTTIEYGRYKVHGNSRSNQEVSIRLFVCLRRDGASTNFCVKEPHVGYRLENTTALLLLS